jgi:hypothetical protein
MDARRIAAPLLGIVLLAAVAVGIVVSHQRQAEERSAIAAGSAPPDRSAGLRGLIGSEKESYFADPRTREALAALGFTVVVEKAGSRAIAGRYEPKNYDFGFPSGAPAAVQLRQQAKAAAVYNPFYTPIVIVSWKPIAKILIANGIVEEQGGAYYITDLPALVELSAKGTRWKEMRGSAAFATTKTVLATSTDVRTSNSAAMYLALLSYVANAQQVVQSQEDVDRVLPVVAPLFLRQGFQEQSTAGPFEDYLALGMGKTPLLVAYESQMIEYWIKHPDKIDSDMVVLYPKPTVFSKHVLVPFTPAGDRLGAALEREPRLIELAHEYGYRTGGETKGPEVWAKHGIRVPEVLVDVIDPPSQEWLERMTQAIEAKFK